MKEEEIEESNLELDPITLPRRRKLLPWWMKIFIWIFLVLGGFIPVAIILNLIGINANLALYGLEATTIFSLTGLIITLSFVIKWFAAFGLWTEKDWAIKLGLVDAVIGIIVCLVVMLIPQTFGLGGFSLRVELILLFPYAFKLVAMRENWKRPH